MSFLDKLGDFTGGFGEGLGETFLPAFQRGWDRQQELSDKADDRAYTEGIRAENREYDEYSYLLKQHAANNDPNAIQGILDNENLTPELRNVGLTALGVAQGNLQQSIDSIIGTSAVGLNKLEVLYGQNANYNNLQTNGVAPQDIFGDINGLDEQKVILTQASNDPSLSEQQQLAINEQVGLIDTEILRLTKKSQGYSAWLGDRTSVLENLSLSFGLAGPEFAEEVLRLQEAEFITPREVSVLMQKNVMGVVTDLVEAGDFGAAYDYASQQKVNGPLRAMILQTIEQGENISSVGTFSQTLGSIGKSGNLLDFVSVIEDIASDDEIVPREKTRLIAEASSHEQNAIKTARAKYDSKYKELNTIDRLDAIGSVAGSPDRAMPAWDRKAKNWLRNDKSNGIPSWYFNRTDWEERLSERGQQTLGEHYADFLNEAIQVGAMSIDDALNRLNTDDWLTTSERSTARNNLNQTPTAMVTPALRDFDLLKVPRPQSSELNDLRYGKSIITDEDTMHIKNRIGRAMVGARRGPTLQKELDTIKNEFQNSDLEQAYIDDIIQYLEDLEGSLDTAMSMQAGTYTGTGESSGPVTTPRPSVKARPTTGSRGNKTTNQSLGTAQKHLEGQTVRRKNEKQLDFNSVAGA